MPSRVASHLPPSPLTWIILVNLEDCLKGRSAVHAQNSSVCRVTSTPFFHICPVCRFKQHMAPATTHVIGKEVFLNCVALQEVVIPTELRDIGNSAFCGCEQLQRFTPWTG